MDQDVNLDMDYVPYEQELVGFVDAVVAMASRLKTNKYIQSENDWTVMEFLYKGWKALYPVQSNEFENHMAVIRAISNPMGVSREKGGATLQAQLEVPQKLHQMIAAFFPLQLWNKKFVAEFAHRFPQFKSSNAKL